MLPTSYAENASMGTGEPQFRPGVSRGRVDSEAHYMSIGGNRRYSTCNLPLLAEVRRQGRSPSMPVAVTPKMAAIGSVTGTLWSATSGCHMREALGPSLANLASAYNSSGV